MAAGQLILAMTILVGFAVGVAAWLALMGWALGLSARIVLGESRGLRRAMVIEFVAFVIGVLMSLAVTIVSHAAGGNPNANDPLTQFVATVAGIVTQSGVYAKMLECSLLKGLLISVVKFAVLMGVIFACGFVIGLLIIIMIAAGMF